MEPGLGGGEVWHFCPVWIGELVRGTDSGLSGQVEVCGCKEVVVSCEVGGLGLFVNVLRERGVRSLNPMDAGCGSK